MHDYDLGDSLYIIYHLHTICMIISNDHRTPALFYRLTHGERRSLTYSPHETSFADRIVGWSPRRVSEGVVVVVFGRDGVSFWHDGLIVPIMNLPFSEKYLHVSDNENTSDGFKNLAICPSASLSRTNIGVGVFPSTLESDRSSNASMSSIMTRSTFNTCV